MNPPTGVAFVATVTYGPSSPESRSIHTHERLDRRRRQHRPPRRRAHWDSERSRHGGREPASRGSESRRPVHWRSNGYVGACSKRRPRVVTVSNLDANANYHWQARTIDTGEGELASDWVSFGNNSDGDSETGADTDFRVPSADLSVSQTTPGSVSASALTPSGFVTRTLIYQVAISNTGPDPAPATVDLDIDSTRFDVSSARYDLKSGNCGVSTSTARRRRYLCNRVGPPWLSNQLLRFGERPVLAGQLAAPANGEALSATNSVSVSSPVHDPTTPNTDSDTLDVYTVPAPPNTPKVSPGNLNAFFQWKHALVADGGQDIIDFRVTVTGDSAPAVPPVLVSDVCGTSGANGSDIFCTNVSPLINTHPYAFVVRARNAVGLSGPTTSQTAIPSIDASAKQISNGGSQHGQREHVDN